jgi:hypothetical protein
MRAQPPDLVRAGPTPNGVEQPERDPADRATSEPETLPARWKARLFPPEEAVHLRRTPLLSSDPGATSAYSGLAPGYYPESLRDSRNGKSGLQAAHTSNAGLPVSFRSFLPVFFLWCRRLFLLVISPVYIHGSVAPTGAIACSRG